jgi:hypothetical protein
MTLERFFSVDKHFLNFWSRVPKRFTERKRKEEEKQTLSFCVCVCDCVLCLFDVRVCVYCICTVCLALYYSYILLPLLFSKKPFPPLQYSGLCLDSVARRRRSRNFGRDLSVARGDPSLRVYSHMVPISRSDNQYIHI